MHCGVMYQNEQNHSWECSDDLNDRRIYVFGDTKTIENENKWIRDLQGGRRLSYDKVNVQGGKFLKATECVMVLPGDWHESMSMLQSIFAVYYYGFLEPIQQLLGWKRIQADVRGCYFQASRFVVFVADEFIRFFLEDYICNVHNFGVGGIKEVKDNPSKMCGVATGFI